MIANSIEKLFMTLDRATAVIPTSDMRLSATTSPWYSARCTVPWPPRAKGSGSQESSATSNSARARSLTGDETGTIRTDGISVALPPARKTRGGFHGWFKSLDTNYIKPLFGGSKPGNKSNRADRNRAGSSDNLFDERAQISGNYVNDRARISTNRPLTVGIRVGYDY